MIASILKKNGSVLVTKDNSNNEIGVPTTLINISAAHNYAVVEMGARNAGDINYLCEIAKPDIALINNILPAHLEGFGDIQNIAKAKGEIYKDLKNNGTAVINIDEPHAQVWIKSTNAKVITFSAHNIQADFSAQNITSKKEGHFNFSLVTPQGTIQINLPLRGKHNIANAVASFAASVALVAPISLNTSLVLLLSKPFAVNLAYSSSATLALSILTALVLDIPNVKLA